MVKRLFKKKVVIGLLVTVFLLTAVGINYAIGVDGPKVKELSLNEAIELALKNNPDIEISNYDVKMAEKKYEGAKKVARDKDDNPNIYEDGLVKWVQPKAAEVALTLAQKGQSLTENSLRFSVESTYYNVLKAERNLAIKRENLNYFQDQLKIAQTGFKVGTKAKVDVSIIESAVASYQALVTNEENNYRGAVMELNRITGLPLETPLKLTTNFTVEKIGGTVNLDETVQKTLADNFDILSVKQNLELKKVQYDVAKRFYGGGVTGWDVNIANLDTKRAEATVRKYELALTSVVKQNYLSLFTLEKMIDWQTKDVEMNKENARVFSLKYGAGLATSLEVKKATLDLAQAEQTLSETIYKYNLLKAQFKYDLFKTSAAGAAGTGGTTASDGYGQ